jgi:WD40 repeat protein
MKQLNADPIVLHGREGPLYILNFSPEGHWLAAAGGTTWTGAGYDSPVHLWNMDKPNADPIALHGHVGDITDIAFSEDELWLATSSSDNTVRLWDVDHLTAQPIILEGAINTLDFSPDGHWLATGGQDTVVRLWNMNIEELVVAACKSVGRNFTRDEWSQYFPDQEYHKTCDQWPPEAEATP